MDEKFIQDFMKIGADTFEDADAIFKLSSTYFLEIKEADYKPEFSAMTEGLLHKMVTIGENFDLDDALLKEITSVSNNFITVVGSTSHNAQQKLQAFNKVVSVSMKFYNAMVKIKPKKVSDVGPFKPSMSDKTGIVSKIMEAIELINSADLVTQKTKDRIIESLNKVISELNKPSTNWDIYYKRISHTILLLGALSNISSPFVGVQQQLIDSRNKLIEANEHLQLTSITINHNEIKEVFIVNENMQIETSEVLKLNKKN